MERPPVQQPGIRGLGLKVGILLLLIPVIAVGLLVYAMYARGVFDRTQSLTLIAQDAEGVAAGMPVMFSGFPIGQVSGMTLNETGQVKIEVRIKVKEARWIRTSSMFTLEKQFFGGAKIRVTSPRMTDPPLPPEAERILVATDAAKDIPQVIARANTILQNIDEIIRPDSPFNQTLANLKGVTGRMSGEYGMLEGITGSRERAEGVLATVENVNALMRSLNGVTARADTVLSKTDEKLFAQGGVMEEMQKSIAQLNAVLADTRDSLRKADAILATAQSASEDFKVVGANVKEATTDLAALRAEVDDRIRKVNVLITEINRRWPFARKPEVKLP
ncbi:MAG TPA: MlaD family protein [Burkholderiales bacterium]|nr:MlaD family protein [Burkholderiales bacterium]